MSGTQTPPGTYTITLVPPSITPDLPRHGTGPFAGWPPAELQCALRQAQQALIAIVTGSKPVMVQYAEGQGHRQVMYSRTNAEEIRVLIRDLQAALGWHVRGAVWPRFG